jgi:hypothetical protein
LDFKPELDQSNCGMDQHIPGADRHIITGLADSFFIFVKKISLSR